MEVLKLKMKSKNFEKILNGSKKQLRVKLNKNETLFCNVLGIELTNSEYVMDQKITVSVLEQNIQNKSEEFNSFFCDFKIERIISRLNC